MKAIVYAVGRRLIGIAMIAVLGCLLSACLVRFTPGFGIDERELDSRLSNASRESIRASHRLESLPSYYGHYLGGALRGDFGYSQWLGQPIGSLIKERFPVTARSVLIGVALAWSLALAISLANVLLGSTVVEIASTVVSGLLIALPAAAVAILSIYLRTPVCAAIAAVTFPKLYRYLGNLLSQAARQPYILAARGRGVSETRILFRHVLPTVAPALYALLGVSISLGFGASIPIEALCDSPGVGQLAWQGALNRDLPLTMTLTLVVTLVTVAANCLANTANERVAS